MKAAVCIDPKFTCGGCEGQWTMHGKVDIMKLNSNWLKCPWCGKILTILHPEESN